jgi:hypothetical protein
MLQVCGSPPVVGAAPPVEAEADVAAVPAGATVPPAQLLLWWLPCLTLLITLLLWLSQLAGWFCQCLIAFQPASPAAAPCAMVKGS